MYTNKILNTERIRELMRTEYMSQNELAEALGVSAATISDWMNGKSLSNEKHIKKIAEELNISEDELVVNTQGIMIGEKSIVYNVFNYGTIHFHLKNNDIKEDDNIKEEKLDSENE